MTLTLTQFQKLRERNLDAVDGNAGPVSAPESNCRVGKEHNLVMKAG